MDKALNLASSASVFSDVYHRQIQHFQQLVKSLGNTAFTLVALRSWWIMRFCIAGWEKVTWITVSKSIKLYVHTKKTLYPGFSGCWVQLYKTLHSRLRLPTYPEWLLCHPDWHQWQCTLLSYDNMPFAVNMVVDDVQTHHSVGGLYGPLLLLFGNRQDLRCYLRRKYPRYPGYEAQRHRWSYP